MSFVHFPWTQTKVIKEYEAQWSDAKESAHLPAWKMKHFTNVLYKLILFTLSLVLSLSFVFNHDNKERLPLDIYEQNYSLTQGHLSNFLSCMLVVTFLARVYRELVAAEGLVDGAGTFKIPMKMHLKNGTGNGQALSASRTAFLPSPVRVKSIPGGFMENTDTLGLANPMGSAVTIVLFCRRRLCFCCHDHHWDRVFFRFPLFLSRSAPARWCSYQNRYSCLAEISEQVPSPSRYFLFMHLIFFQFKFNLSHTHWSIDKLNEKMEQTRPLDFFLQLSTDYQQTPILKEAQKFQTFV